MSYCWIYFQKNFGSNFCFNVCRMSSENPESTDLDLNSLQQAQLLPQFISILKIRKKSKKKLSWIKGLSRRGRPATTISSPSHIILIFSSDPPRNPRPSNIIFLNIYFSKIKQFFKDRVTLEHKQNMKFL